MRREKAKDPELIVLWGPQKHELTIGITRAVGWEVLGSASKDGMHARWDCPDDWARWLVTAFITLRENPEKDLSSAATHELVPPRYRELRAIEPEADEQLELFEVTP